MAPRRPAKNIIVSEKFRVNAEIALRNFLQNENAQTFEFPCTLTNIERAWVHDYVKTMGLRSKSHGKEPSRYLIISKPDNNISNTDRMTLTITEENISTMTEFVNRYPGTKDKLDTYGTKMRSKLDAGDTNMGQLTFGIPQMPTFGLTNELINFRMRLPIWPMRARIMEAIVGNQVLIVCGETGSGKTTQIPQFILDYSASCYEKCRIICTQPRRISAVAVAERVATERGEKSGQTVGFHIRLESCVGPKTVLVYCTNGILLRTLMNGDTCLNSFTHIIVDEIHERDRFSDFLLICLRECLVRYPHLRLILMSATIDVATFVRYFNNAPVINIPGRLHPVTQYYLEDVLKMTNYESQIMRDQKKKQRVTIPSTRPTMDALPEIVTDIISPDLKIEMEECIMECVEHGSDDSFAQLLQLILSDHVPINFQHSTNGYTGLMAAAMHGNHNICMQLLTFGANTKLWSKDNCTAFDFACMRQHIECAEMLKHYETYDQTEPVGQATKQHVGHDSTQLLELYHSSISDQVIDFDLLHLLLCHIHRNTPKGSILVFLAGYEDIITVKDRVMSDGRFNTIPYEIFMLHGHMQISDQHRVFNPLPGKRKIILSTNIAETSITIDDVVFVIDSGKVKEKCYDAVTGVCSLQCAWISQAGAKQRAGRAGRTQPGICYHMFSKYRYTSMQTFATPEILRMPLHELCLQTKMLAPKETKIADFLARAIEAPSAMAVNSAIKHLQEIDALDDNEDLTFLGQHLVDLPVEPRLAKMLLYSVIFKCIDPMLTIVAFLSYRDPFVLPSVHQQKSVAVTIRKQFSLNSFSDHAILLRVFQAWQEARVSKSEKTFCNKHFVSTATMEMVVNIRSQLLAQLRASGFVKTKPPGDIRDLNENANNWALIKAILATGLYPNVAYINRHSKQIKTKKEKKVMIHATSALRNSDRGHNNSDHAQSVSKIPSDWLIYEELSRSGNLYNMRSVTSITPLTVAIFLDNSINNNTVEREDSESDDEAEEPTIVLNDWIVFEAEANIIHVVSAFRNKLNCMIRKKIINPYKLYTGHDEALLQTLSTILAREDTFTGYLQPPGIGQRPKIMMPNHYPHDANATANHKQRFIMKKQNSAMSDILFLNRVTPEVYNKYVPQDLVGELESEDVSEKAAVEENIPTAAVAYNPPHNYAASPYPINDMSMISQGFQNISMSTSGAYYPLQQYKMNPYYPQTSEYFDNSSSAETDFQDNGVNVDVSGAYALNPSFTMNAAFAPKEPYSVDPHYTLNSPLLWNPFFPPEQPYTPEPSSAVNPPQSVGYEPTYNIPHTMQLRNAEHTSFYIIKPATIKSIEISITKKTWTFSPQIEKKLIKVLQTGRTVVLIFTVQGSSCFQGIARLLSGPSSELSHYNHNCPIDWLSRADVTFEQVKGLLNTNFSEGEELDSHIGIMLWTMFTNCKPKTPMQLEPTETPVGRPIKKSSRM